MNKVVKAVISILTVLLVAFAVLFTIPKVEESKELKKQKQEEEARENERLARISEDLDRIAIDEYNGVFLSMTEASGWSPDVFSGYIGMNVLKTNGIINTSDELMNAWYQAEMSGNDLSYCVFIIDPYKLCDIVKNEAGQLEFSSLHTDYNDIFSNHPESEFRVFMPFYDIKYWEDHTEESFAIALKAYRDVMNDIVRYENVVLSCYTGYEWMTRNPRMFNEDGGLVESCATALFLYNYRDYWQLTPQKVDGIISIMEKELFFEDPVEVKKHFWDYYFKEKEEALVYDYPGFEDYDVVFLGDSLFALFDGPYSMPSYFENMTGARVYNISKGGLTVYHESDENMSLGEYVDNIINCRTVDYENYDVFNREMLRFNQDNHEGRKLLFITDLVVNDYIFSSPARGEDSSSYEGALREGLEKLQEAYPQAEIVSFSIYYILDAVNGTNENAAGCVLNDYKEVLKEVSSQLNIKYIDMEKESPIEEVNSGYYLDDGLHPSMAGSWEVSKILCEKILEQ